jgi:hypothetical protein
MHRNVYFLRCKLQDFDLGIVWLILSSSAVMGDEDDSPSGMSNKPLRGKAFPCFNYQTTRLLDDRRLETTKLVDAHICHDFGQILVDANRARMVLQEP